MPKVGPCKAHTAGRRQAPKSNRETSYAMPQQQQPQPCSIGAIRAQLQAGQRAASKKQVCTWDGCRTQVMTRLPRCAPSAWHRPTVVVLRVGWGWRGFGSAGICRSASRDADRFTVEGGQQLLSAAR